MTEPVKKFSFAEKYPMNESLWRHAERNMIARERSRHIRSGVITQSYRMQPQLMVLKDGKWTPEIKTYG